MGIALHIEGTVQDIFDPVLRHTQQMNIGGDLANLGFERRTVQPGIRTALRAIIGRPDDIGLGLGLDTRRRQKQRDCRQRRPETCPESCSNQPHRTHLSSTINRRRGAGHPNPVLLDLPII